MRNATRFTFDTVFHPGSRTQDGAASGSRKYYTEAEVEALRQEARAEGMRAGEDRSLETLSQCMRDLVEAVRLALAQATAETQSIRSEAAAIAFALARKVAGAAVSSFPAGEVEAALRQAMHQAVGEPRIVLRARPDVIETLSGRISEIAHDEGYDGRVQFSPDAALSGADCRIEWRGGGAERSGAVIEAAIEELMGRHFANSGDTGSKE